jgi:hypothetical protein
VSQHDLTSVVGDPHIDFTPSFKPLVIIFLAEHELGKNVRVVTSSYLSVFAHAPIFNALEQKFGGCATGSPSHGRHPLQL